MVIIVVRVCVICFNLVETTLHFQDTGTVGTIHLKQGLFVLNVYLLLLRVFSKCVE